MVSRYLGGCHGQVVSPNIKFPPVLGLIGTQAGVGGLLAPIHFHFSPVLGSWSLHSASLSIMWTCAPPHYPALGPPAWEFAQSLPLQEGSRGSPHWLSKLHPLSHGNHLLKVNSRAMTAWMEEAPPWYRCFLVAQRVAGASWQPKKASSSSDMLSSVLPQCKAARCHMLTFISTFTTLSSLWLELRTEVGPWGLQTLSVFWQAQLQ